MNSLSKIALFTLLSGAVFAAQERYLASLNITLQRATALYRHGAVSYIEVLSAQRDIFTTRQTLLELNYSRQANEITLFTALGGGWME